MAINKVVYGNQTLIDLTTDTVASSDDILAGKVGHLRDGTVVTGTASGGDQHGTIWQDGQGYVHLDDESGIALQSKSVTPSESQQVIEADQGYYALDTVTVGAISSSYVGSGVSRRSSSDLTANGATVTAPAGYYESSASKAVASGTAGTPTATKGSVSNHAVTVTPSVTNTTGYIIGGTKTGTAVTVTASELVSGSETKTENGTYNVTNLQTLVVNVSGGGGDIDIPIFTVNSDTMTATCNMTYNEVQNLSTDAALMQVYVSGELEETYSASLWKETEVSSSSSRTYSVFGLHARPNVGVIYNSDGTIELLDGPPNLTNLTVTSNGTYTDVDYKMYKKVTVNVPSSAPTLITKTITANGTYNASSDSADGYSSVTVNVSGGGGASNFVYGTIIAGTEGSIQTVTIPYNGNGYIVALRLFVDGGNQSTSQSDWYNVIHTYAVSQLSLVKTRMETAPDYTQNNVFINGADVMCQYKNSTSSGTTISSGTGGSGVRVYRNDIDPTNGSTTCLYLNSNNSFKVKICNAENGTYGLLSGVSYTYVAIFSE